MTECNDRSNFLATKSTTLYIRGVFQTVAVFCHICVKPAGYSYTLYFDHIHIPVCDIWSLQGAHGGGPGIADMTDRIDNYVGTVYIDF